MRTIEFEAETGWMERALVWASRFPFACRLDGNHYSAYPFGPFRNLLAVGSTPVSDSTDWKAIIRAKPAQAWWFGYLGYGLLENGRHADERSTFLSFPPFRFFEAEAVLEQHEYGFTLHAANPEEIREKIGKMPLSEEPWLSSEIRFQAFRTKHRYLSDVEAVQDQIREGNVYELNLCQFFSASAHPDGLQFYRRLNRYSPMPFSGWLKAGELEIASASPERYLRKRGQQLISQPIKGTRPRGNTESEDEILELQLRNSEKERAENMMIVDLVRNDLARVSRTGSTQVPEIFGIYAFPSVFQMISTVTSHLQDGLDEADAVASSFPMGSMTGAPKSEVLKWIRKMEPFQRGAFSGALGYFGPDGDFDFNVLIRSLFINHKEQKCGFAVGSAVTIDSVGEQEWEECGSKASTLLQVCGSQNWETIHEPWV